MLADLPAELERERRERLGRRRHHQAGRGAAAGERHLVDTGVAHERVAGRRAADHDVQHAGRQPGLERELGEAERAERRELRAASPRRCCRPPARAPPSGPCPSSGRSTARWRRRRRRARGARRRGRRPRPARPRRRACRPSPRSTGVHAAVYAPERIALTGVPLSSALIAARLVVVRRRAGRRGGTGSPSRSGIGIAAPRRRAIRARRATAASTSAAPASGTSPAAHRWRGCGARRRHPSRPSTAAVADHVAARRELLDQRGGGGRVERASAGGAGGRGVWRPSAACSRRRPR